MQAKHLGLAALAVTDRNTLAGVVRAHGAAKDAELPFVVGARLDLDRAVAARLAHHARRLWPLVPPAQPRPAPRRQGPVPAHARRCLRTSPRASIFALLPGSADHLAEVPPRLKAPLYLAVSHHLPRRRPCAAQPACRAGAAAPDVPLLATNDVLYHHAARRVLQDVVTAIREGVAVAAAGYRLEANAERHLKTPEEMARLFRDHPQAIANTLEIAAACRFSLDELRYEYPEEPIPPGRTPQAHLDASRLGGREASAIRKAIPGKVKENIAKELALIAKLNYAPYFLTVHDIVALRPAAGAAHPLPGAGIGRQFHRVLLHRHHRGRPQPDRAALRALHLGGAQGAARHRRRLRARAPRGGDPVHLCPLRPRARRPCRHRHHLSRPLGRARGGQGHGPVGRRDRGAGRHRLGPHARGDA